MCNPFSIGLKRLSKAPVTMGVRSERLPLVARPARPSRARQTLILVACMYLHFTSLGFTVSLGVVYVELIRYFAAPRSIAAIVQSLYQGLTLLGGMLFSRVVRTRGVAIPTMTASVCGSLALVISSLSPSIYMVIVFIGLIGGLAMSVNYLSAFVAVGATFQSHRKTALAVLTMATAVGQTLLPYMVETLVAQYGWTGACIIAGGLMLNSLPCGLILYTSRKYFYSDVNIGTQKVDTSSNETNAKVRMCVTRKEVACALFIIVSALYQGTGAVESWFVVDLADMRGYGRQAGTALLSLLGLCGLGGRILGTTCLAVRPTVSTSLPLAAAFTVFGLGHFIVIYFTSYSGMLAGVIVRGLSIGCVMCFQPGMLLELGGIARFPQTVAVCNLFSGSSQILCGYLGGLTADLTGSYDLAFYIATGTAIVCAVCLIVIRVIV